MIPYGRQSVDQHDVDAVVAAMCSERLTQGPRLEAFEEKLAARVGAAEAVAFSSGTAALHGALAAAGIGPGHRVAVPALTFVASAACAAYVGASPVLVDIDESTFNLDVERVPTVDALVAVHFAGLPVDLARLRHRPPVIVEDAAHALGALTPDGPVGSCARSDMCVFSFHPVKAITTGEGGAVTTNSAELAERLRRLRHHGAVPQRERGGWYSEVPELGFNYRLSDIHAALGSSQLDRLEHFIIRRNQIADRYRTAFTGTAVVLPPAASPGWRHAYHLFVVRVPDRGRAYDALHAAGIGVQVHYVPLYRHPALQKYVTSPDAFPATEAVYGGALSLPLFPDLTDAEQDEVVAAVLDTVGTAKRGAPPRPAERGRELARSSEWWDRARRVIPLGTQTLSKSPTQFARGVSPMYLVRGAGAHVWDVDGNRYLDYPMALGPVLLGYADPAVDAAIRRQLADGITFTLMHPLEVEVAERIVALCPGVEAVRFAKTGSDVLSAAVRAARALTGRDVVLVAGYHGWHEWYIGSTSRAAGVPTVVRELVAPFVYGDIVDLDRAFDEHHGQVAAVVIEPSGALTPPPGYLQAVIDRAARAGAVSVFDEVITGFRLAPGGARERYGVEPDLSCYGKALGNGMPVAAVAGSWAVMQAFEDVFFSGTHGGETLSLAAAKAVLDAIADGSVLAGIERTGLRLRDGIASLVEEHGVGARVSVGGEPHRGVVGFRGPQAMVDRTWVQQSLVERGILFNGSMFVCARHDDADVDATLAAFDAAFEGLASDDDLTSRLHGPAAETVFTP